MFSVGVLLQSNTSAVLSLLQVVCTVKLDESAVPCDLQFDPLSKAFLLLLCSNGAISLYGINEQNNALDLVSLSVRKCAHTGSSYHAIPHCLTHADSG
jgi:hypothetical protein